MRYVAQKGGLWGKTPADAALIDMIAEGIRDARGVVVSFPFQGDQVRSPWTKCPKFLDQEAYSTINGLAGLVQEKAMLVADVPARTAFACSSWARAKFIEEHAFGWHKETTRKPGADA